MVSTKKFGQAECAHYLNQCEDQDQVEDVLTAYVYTKFARGANAPQVLHKLYLLVCYLKATRQTTALERFPRGLLIVQYHIQFLNGGAIGARPTTNPLAHEVWNLARRVSFKPSRLRPARSASADEEERLQSEWGALGPGPLMGLDSVNARRDNQRLRVTALEPDEVALMGRNGPTYRSLTLPPYDDDDDREQDIST